MLSCPIIYLLYLPLSRRAGGAVRRQPQRHRRLHHAPATREPEEDHEPRAQGEEPDPLVRQLSFFYKFSPH